MDPWTIFALITAIAGTASSVQQNQQSRRIADEQKRAQSVEQAVSRQEQFRQIRQQIARNRVIVAQQQALSFAGGTVGSSTVAGNVSALGTDFAGSVAAANTRTAGMASTAAANNRISSIRSQFDPYAAVAGITGAFANPQVWRSYAGPDTSATTTPPTE